VYGPTGRDEIVQRAHVRRLGVALVLALVVWSVIVVRLVCIQVVHGPRLAGYAERQQVVTVELAPDRGVIFDRNLTPLTDNLDVHSVCAHPREIASPARAARDLARVLGGSRQAYQKLLSKNTGFVWLERQVPPERASAVAALSIKGVELLPETKRVYPHGERACHVLGYTDIDGRGISGVEQQMDELLRGTPATVEYHLDCNQRRSPAPSCSRVVPEDGESIVLTLDAGLQEICEVELERAVREQEAKGGTVIVQDPWTGEILAMANWPTFDCNRFARYAEECWRNRAVTDQFEPGSTFKVVTACAAIETGAADESSVYYASQGKRKFGSFTIRDVKPHGWLNFRGALKKSSNVCFAEIGGSVGEIPLYSYARDFGFGCLTAINLPGEVRGTLAHPSDWSRRSVYTIAIGQEIAVTALQLAGAYSAVANGGYLMEPHIVKAVVTSEGRVVEEAVPCVVRQVVRPEVAALVRDMMKDIPVDGTGRNAAVPEFAVAGKTGTAQKVVPGIPGYAPGKHVSSFAGFAPADDPGVVILVVVDEPKGRGLGGEVAAPVFRRIVERVVRSASHELVLGRRNERAGYETMTCSAEPDLVDGLIEQAIVGDMSGGAEPAPGATRSGGPVVHAADGTDPRFPSGASSECIIVPASFTGQGGEDVDALEMPDLVGMSLRRARRTAAGLGLELAFDGAGLVHSQSPRTGSAVRPGDRIRVECR